VDNMSTRVTLWESFGPHGDSVGTPCHPVGPRGTPWDPIRTLWGHHVNPCHPVRLLGTPWGLCGDTMSPRGTP